MAEGFEPYHIPQQSRREKLRVVTTGCVGDLLPLYDQSSFISSSPNLLSKQPRNITSSLMATATSNSDYATAMIDESLDLQSVNDPDNNHCNFLYTHQDLRFIQHHPFDGSGDFLVYKPEPLALSLSSHNGTHPLQKYESTGLDFCRTAVMTLGPYTGYASILKGSKFLKPTQQLLDEICDVGFGVDCGLMTDPPSLENLRTTTSVDHPNCGSDTRKRSRLISLLDEVYKRYKHYYQQIQAVITSFETVSGLSSAAPFANLDLKAMSKNFRCLNNAITDQLQFSVKPHEHQISYRREELMWSGSSNDGLYGQKAINNMGFVDHQPVWRPQRGLPKRAVTVLRAWLFDHFLHPMSVCFPLLICKEKSLFNLLELSNRHRQANISQTDGFVPEPDGQLHSSINQDAMLYMQYQRGIVPGSTR
ncbi:BEL1-like homeodomain protein 9 isoform X3 [Cynara cardunculus var. scolymus]|uniref:BEL1-like homeodomain protein 9 isoform X3 n=1 Tax=Cynara cardunculus var. scolymus TaxID=59895 RepID=UPI000D63149D|nr:BEL1-like homeodomain protein 9 isoform X3 [Cynara cardunculus var. scolymus]